MEPKNNCTVCGKRLVYSKEHQQMECTGCKQTFEGNAKCVDGHYVCDRCHQAKAMDIIEQYCLKSDSTDPFEIALALMTEDAVKMHGPEHHFLVPAAMLSAYYNKRRLRDKKKDKLAEARKRAQNVPGGFCGFYGNCGAAVGTGIFISILTGATPMSKKEWRLANLMTSKSLAKIAEQGGPRCCKRSAFIAIQEAVAFLEENFGTKLDTAWSRKCQFHELNEECQLENCPFFG